MELTRRNRLVLFIFGGCLSHGLNPTDTIRYPKIFSTRMFRYPKILGAQMSNFFGCMWFQPPDCAIFSFGSDLQRPPSQIQAVSVPFLRLCVNTLFAFYLQTQNLLTRLRRFPYNRNFCTGRNLRITPHPHCPHTQLAKRMIYCKSFVCTSKWIVV